MAIKYQFNKISMQNMRKQLKIRLNALPTLKSKEAALRTTVKKYKQELKELRQEYDAKMLEIEKQMRLWAEYPDGIFYLREAVLSVKKIAGVKTPVMEDLEYDIHDFSRFQYPSWLNEGVEILKSVAVTLTEIEVAEKRIEILEYARKKTTQKVNLYEKVQIPEYSEAILKIKRYLEDVENLEKAAQKITKQKQQAAGARG